MMSQVIRANLSSHQVVSSKLRAPASPHVLYLVSTPIGNTGDISQRAIDVLSTVDVIAAEDTRRTGLLLKRLDVSREPRGYSGADVASARGRDAMEDASGSRTVLISCHAHNWKTRTPELLNRLRAGESVAVVSDAGTPCVSDPGAELAAAAVEAGIRVVPVPGACAALAAIVGAALPAGVHFVVVGFIPRAGSARTAVLERIAGSYKNAAVVLYEAPHRIQDTLCRLAELEIRDERSHSYRSVCLAREVTKTHEEFLRFPNIREAAEWYQPSDDGTSRQPRGEYTIVLGPEHTERGADTSGEAEVCLDDVPCDVHTLVTDLVHAGVPASLVAKSIAKTTPLPRKVLYALASAAKEEKAIED